MAVSGTSHVDDVIVSKPNQEKYGYRRLEQRFVKLEIPDITSFLRVGLFET